MSYTRSTGPGVGRRLCDGSSARSPGRFASTSARSSSRTAVMVAGCVFGAAAIAFDSDAKAVIMPFSHLKGDPAERVRDEERQAEGDDTDHMAGSKSAFAAMLMTNNTRVSILAMAMGITWGIGTITLLFYNGVILGAVVADYVLAGETAFLVGWLLPHGSIEIPSILLAGQAGLILASALIGRSSPEPLRMRMRKSLPSLVTLIFGVAILLIWAGIVEAFFSQYHEPVLPYSLKIVFGCVQLVLLAMFLGLSGRARPPRERESE